MVEVHYFARIAKLTIEETLKKMKAAGVDSCPGGGAEIFHPRVRRIICDHKVSGQIVAHTRTQSPRSGLALERDDAIRTRETEEERVDHLSSCASCRT